MSSLSQSPRDPAVGLGALFRRVPGMRLAGGPRFADRYPFRGPERLVVLVA